MFCVYVGGGIPWIHLAAHTTFCVCEQDETIHFNKKTSVSHLQAAATAPDNTLS